MAIPLEDNASDIIGKAQRGLGISDTQLAERSGVTADKIRKLREGDFAEDAIELAAPVLGLDAGALRKLVAGKWILEAIEEIDGLAQFNTNYGDMTVNAYLVWDPTSREAVAFDTGADCGGMLRRIEQEKLSVKLILLTHAHPDHVADLRRLKKTTGAPVYLSKLEKEEGAEAVEEGKRFRIGALEIEARLTSGHSPGGMTYVVTGLARPVAIVGDSLFAGSMGGGNVSYDDAVRNNREKILTLPEETIVCPGHGPLTSVGKEKRDNPFFASVSR
ncbi:MAG: hydroxyacylglutathione hydrolase [Verrucomicrobiota bacterium]|jgi:glyoxylase-like metal-dependent hydrolase (beta-lactamase superfamily II)